MAEDFQFLVELAVEQASSIQLNGYDIGSLTINALNQPVGQQKARYSSDVAGALGSNPIFEIRVGGVVKYRTTIPGTLTGTSAGIALPNALNEPPSINVADPLTASSILVAIRNATNSAIEITIPLVLNES